MTDQEILSEVQSLLAEPQDGGATWPSAQWTPTEVIGYLNDSQQELIASTGAILMHATVPCTPHNFRHPLPEGWIATQRCSWKRASDSRRFLLSKADLWQLNHGLPAWRESTGIPKLYTDADTPTLTIQIAPAASVPGVLELIYLAVPPRYDGTGVPSVVPDEAAVGIPWQTIAHQLTKEGRGKDPNRALVADARAALCLDALKLLLAGWEA